MAVDRVLTLIGQPGDWEGELPAQACEPLLSTKGIFRDENGGSITSRPSA